MVRFSNQEVATWRRIAFSDGLRPFRLSTNATGRSFSFTGSFALFRSAALVEVAAEPIDQPRNVFVGSLNHGETGSGGEHERGE
jgi:hypothetical protein